MPSKVKKLQDEIIALKIALDAVKQENAELRGFKQRCKTLESDLKAAQEERYDHVASCGFAFDFKHFRAFSIERIFKDGREYTSIGYLKYAPDKVDHNEVKKWSFYCNRVTHEKLVEDFRESLKAHDK